MELPAWEDCCVVEVAERATALEAFIYCNEPEGEEDAAQFRSMLLAVLEEATAPAVPQVTHHCPNCEAAARELADIAAVLRTGSSGDTLLGKEVSQWIDTAHAVEAERDDLYTLCDKQADILSRIAIALRGQEPPQTKWSHHDLPERAAKIKQEIAHLHAGILRIIEDYPRDIKQDAEEALRALLAETETK